MNRSRLQRMKWLDTYLRPSREDVLLDQFITNAVGNGWILNLGSGQWKSWDRMTVINLDLDYYPNMDIQADGHEMPFASNVFDVVYMGNVIEHLKRPWIVADEVHRILKPGGHVLVTAPFIYPYHDMPGDYYRFTDKGLQEIFHQFVKVETGIGRYGSGTLVELLKTYASAWFIDERRADFAAAFTSVLLNPFKQVDRLLIKRSNHFWLAGGFYYLGCKA